MTISAWIFMTCVWTAAFALASFCYYRMLTSRRLSRAPGEEAADFSQGDHSHGSS